MARNGFSLIELLVALTLAGLGVSVALGIFGTSTDVARALDAQVEDHERVHNARRWLAQALYNVEVDVRRDLWFDGSARELRFHTRLWVSDGWLEPTTVTLSLQDQRLTARTAEGVQVTLARSIAGVELDYLRGPGAQSPWLAAWESSVAPPQAVRLRVEYRGQPMDTLLFYIGERG